MGFLTSLTNAHFLSYFRFGASLIISTTDHASIRQLLGFTERHIDLPYLSKQYSNYYDGV